MFPNFLRRVVSSEPLGRGANDGGYGHNDIGGGGSGGVCGGGGDGDDDGGGIG